MTSLSRTLRAFSSRTGLRRALVVCALYDMVEFTIWLGVSAIIRFDDHQIVPATSEQAVGVAASP